MHYLADSIRNYLKNGSQFGVSIQYTFEPELLGTGGGVKNAEPLLGNEPFVLVNCDFVSNIDLRPVIEQHLRSRAIATMVLTPNKGGDYTPVYYNQLNQLSGIGKPSGLPAISATFTGIHILSPKALTYLRPVHSGINHDLYPRLIVELPGSAQCFLDNKGQWFDTGDLTTLYSTSIELLKELHLPHAQNTRDTLEIFAHYFEVAPGVWVPQGKTLPGSVSFKGPCIIGGPEKIGSGSRVGPHVILSAESTVSKNASLSNIVTLGENALQEEPLPGLYYQTQNLIKEKGP